jgi:hypothetical protein
MAPASRRSACAAGLALLLATLAGDALATSLTLSGETFVGSVLLLPGEFITGFGTVQGTVIGQAGSSITPVGGPLTLGIAAAGGFATSGTIAVGAATLNLIDSDGADLGSSTTLAGGVIGSTLAVVVNAPAETLSGFGTITTGVSLANGTAQVVASGGLLTVNGNVAGLSGTIDANGGDLLIGNAASTSGYNHNGVLSVRDRAVTLRDADLAQLGSSTTLAGGTLAAANGLENGAGDNLSGFGTLDANVTVTGGTVTASGGSLLIDGRLSGTGGTVNAGSEDVTAGSAVDAAGVSYAGTLSVGTRTVTLLDADAAEIGDTTLGSGGVLAAANGIDLGAGDVLAGSGAPFSTVNGGVTLSGSGASLSGVTVNGDLALTAAGASLGSATVNGDVSGAAGSTISPSSLGAVLGDLASATGFSHQGNLFVSGTVTLRDADQAELGAVTTLSGGTLIAANGLLLGAGDALSGSGTIAADVALSGSGASLTASVSLLTVDGEVAGGAGTTIAATTGDALLGDAASAAGFSHQGALAVGARQVTLRDANAAELGTSTTLAGGTLVAANGVALDGGDSISGFGLVRGAIAGGTFAPTAVFSPAAGFAVGADDVTILSSAFSTLSGTPTLAGGTLRSTGGVFLPGGAVLSGSGAVATRVASALGQTITATGALALGDAAAVDGYFSDGVLTAGGHTVTLNDANEAVLGSLTTLAGGTLAAPNGAFVAEGRNLTGFGLVSADLHMDGDVVAQGGTLELSGDVFGIGDYAGSVIFSGTFSPGHSPGEVELEQIGFAGSATLAMEIAGREPGSGHDRLLVAGEALLDGVLLISVLDGFEVQAGDVFELARWGSHAGAFDAVVSAGLAGGLRFEPRYTPGGLWVVAAIPEPSTVALVGGALLALGAARRRRAR